MNETYDVAVMGLGAMGSAAVLALRRRNVSVIGFDQFTPPHKEGSHGGNTRVFRLAHYDNPKYVPLAKRASTLWDRLSEDLGVTLVNRIGLLKMGPEKDGLLNGIRKSCEEFDIPFERLSASEVRHRYPAFQIPDDFIGHLEPTAGWIDVDAAIIGMQRRARELGAELRLNERVNDWKVKGNAVRINVGGRDIDTHKIIITAGAWTTQILQDLDLPIHLVRKMFCFFNPLEPEKFSEQRIPVFGFPHQTFYAFPNIRGMGVKAAEHLGGDEIDRPDVLAEPESPGSILKTVSTYMPALAGPPPGDVARVSSISTCLYSLTPDEDFIIDLHPGYPNVAFAGGFSGHGFKFVPVVGEVMADLALQGDTAFPIDFLRWKRFA